MSTLPAESFGKFSPRTRAVLVAAQRYAEAMETSLGSEHILLALAVTAETTAYSLLRKIPITLDQLRLVLHLEKRSRTKARITDEAKIILERAAFRAATHSASTIDTEHLLWALVSDGQCTAYRMIQHLGVEPKSLRKALEHHLHEQRPADVLRSGSDIEILGFIGAGEYEQPGELRSPAPTPVPVPEEPSESQTPALDEFAVELVAEAAGGHLDPVVGRQEELDRLIHILGRKTKNNPVLVGEPGVGKTAIVEGLARRIAEGNVPEYLAGAQLYALEIAGVVAGTMYRGQFEERLRRILSELLHVERSLLFVDEIHTLVGAGGAEGALDAANILKPLLAKGQLRLIGATTNREYRRSIEKDSALERRLQPISVGEPSPEETEAILRGLVPHYEDFHELRIPSAVITEAVRVAGRFLHDRRFPDKAIDVLDEAAALVRARQSRHAPQPIPSRIVSLERDLKIVSKEKQYELNAANFERAAFLRDKEAGLRIQLKQLREAPRVARARRTVSVDHIHQVVSRWSGIPIEQIRVSDRQTLLRLEETFQTHIIGQDEALGQLAKAVRRAKAGVRRARGPMATFLIVGPTGVGKTETARVLATEVFGDAKNLVKLDMSEFSERHQAARLVGAPPGYVGHDETSKLYEALKTHPHQVVLFDEIEKAHPDLMNLLLQIMEDGVLTDGRGRTIHFRDTLVILTSNIGSELWGTTGQLGFTTTDQHSSPALPAVSDRVKKHFRPEFLSRLDGILFYRPLTPQSLATILTLELDRLVTSVTHNHHLTLHLSQTVRDYLLDRARQQGEGARSIRQIVETEIGSLIAETLLRSPKKRILRIEQRNGVLVPAGRARQVA